LMRWGNYDVKNGTRWVASEVPSGLSQFANPVPSSQTLPVSFYLSAKPSWWGTMPWPAIGSDVTGGMDATGHVYANPAQACYNKTSKDSAGILIFNADNCYQFTPSSTPPAPPTPPPPPISSNTLNTSAASLEFNQATNGPASAAQTINVTSSGA